LLDPYDVTIASVTANGAFDGGTPNVFTPTGTATINVTDITAALNAGTSVSITTGSSGTDAGNITVSSAITPSITTGSPTLTLTAAGSITIGAGISDTSGTLNVVLSAGTGININSAIDVAGTVSMDSGTVNGTSGITLAANVTGISGVTFSDAVTLSGGARTVTTTNNSILFSGAINGAQALTLNAGAGAITIGAVTGSTGLTLTGGAINTVAIGLADNSVLSVTNTGASEIAGMISGTGVTLTKAGAGTLTLSGNNSYTGATTVSAGTLAVSHSNALGTTDSGTTISNGATLSISNGITIADAISVAGTGVSSGGVIRSTSGANTLTGLITQTAASTILSDAGTLTLDTASGNALTGTFNLTLGGVGNIVVADPIAIGSGR